MPNVISIDSLSFDTIGWQLDEENDSSRQWSNVGEHILSLHFFMSPPDIPCELTEIDLLRRAYRAAAIAAQGGLVECELFRLQNYDAVRTIYKLPIPDRPHGCVYVGAITLPFRDFSLVVRVQAMEGGVSGVRDTIVLQEQLAAGKVHFNEAASEVIGWAGDPYEPIETPLMPNLSDRPEYDARFPDHPLSVVRRELDRISRSASIAEELASAPGFVG